MAADAATATADGRTPSGKEGRSPFVTEANVIRVSKSDNWEGVGIRTAAAACGTGVAQLRAVGRDSVYAAIKGFIHARSICALRGLDLQLTAGYTSIRIGANADLVSAIIFYAWARTPDQPVWEQAPDEH